MSCHLGEHVHHPEWGQGFRHWSTGVSSLILRKVLQLMGVFTVSLAVGWAQSFPVPSSFWSVTDLFWGILRKMKNAALSTAPIHAFSCLSCAQTGHWSHEQWTPCLQPALLQLRTWPTLEVIHFSPGLCDMQSFLGRRVFEIALQASSWWSFARKSLLCVFRVQILYSLTFFGNVHQDFSCITSSSQLSAWE